MAETATQLGIPRSLYTGQPSDLEGVSHETGYDDRIIAEHAEVALLVRDALTGGLNDTQFCKKLASHYDNPLNSLWVTPSVTPEDIPEGVEVAHRIESESARKAGLVRPSPRANWEQRPSLLVARATFPSINGNEAASLLGYQPANIRVMALIGVPVSFGEERERAGYGVTTELLPSEGWLRRALAVESPYFQAVKGTLSHIIEHRD